MIRQMQAALDEEQRIVNTLHKERDEAQNSARIWERDLSVLHVDYHRLHASFNRLILRFYDLKSKVEEDHPKFQMSTLLDWGPP
jgi:predicted nuclease with TOPRIM domain